MEQALTYDTVISNLKNGANFAYARYGDGELFCMQGKKGHNCDKHEYFPDLGEALRDSLKEQKYHWGIRADSREELSKFLPKGAVPSECSIFVEESKGNRMYEFFKAIRGRELIFVAPSHIGVGFNYREHITIDKENCWKDYEFIREYIEDYVCPNDVVIFCAGMMSCVLIDDLYHMYPDTTYIDMGSVLDPYFGVISRGYQKEMQW